MIETDRLTLRRWKESDLAPFAAMNSCERVCEFLPKTLSREESDAAVEKIERHFEKHGCGLFALEVKGTGEFIGFTGLNIPSFEAHFMPAVEIGWRLGASYWGKGYATEAAKAVLSHGFEFLGLDEIVSFTVPENIRSCRIMEKIGMHYDKRGDFSHPKLPDGHRLREHVLYRVYK